MVGLSAPCWKFGVRKGDFWANEVSEEYRSNSEDVNWSEFSTISYKNKEIHISWQLKSFRLEQPVHHTYFGSEGV